MVDIAAAQAELRVVEGFLRKRYHYPHPIFENLTAAQEHLAEGAAAAPVVHPEQPATAAPGPETTLTTTEVPPEPKRRATTRRTTKRANK